MKLSAIFSIFSITGIYALPEGTKRDLDTFNHAELSPEMQCQIVRQMDVQTYFNYSSTFEDANICHTANIVEQVFINTYGDKVLEKGTELVLPIFKDIREKLFARFLKG